MTSMSGSDPTDSVYRVDWGEFCRSTRDASWGFWSRRNWIGGRNYREKVLDKKRRSFCVNWDVGKMLKL